MSQTSVIFFFLVVGFIIYLAAKNRVQDYVNVFGVAKYPMGSG